MAVVLQLVVALGMLVLMPIGLHLIDDHGARLVLRFWWVFAGPGVLCLFLSRGPMSVAPAVIYAAGTALLVVAAIARLCRLVRLVPEAAGVRRLGPEIAVLTALICPAVAATALVAERGGYPLFGFSLGILALTVPHLHFAGFAAALIAGLVAREVGPGRLSDIASLAVPLGTLTVLLGYFTGRWIELLGAIILTIGMWSVAFLTITRIRSIAVGLPRVLLAVSSWTLVATMLLALSWAFGRAAGLPHLSINWMIATHGVANAVGFALCAVLAWRLLRATPSRSGPMNSNGLGRAHLMAESSGAHRVGPHRAGTELVGPDRVDAELVGPYRAGAELVGPYRAGTELVGPARVDPGQVNLGRVSPYHAGTDRAGADLPTPDLAGVDPNRSEFTYRDVGLTMRGLRNDSARRSDGQTGYRRLGFARQLRGRNFDAVAHALMTWGIHARAGIRVESEADRAAVGVDVRTCFGIGRAVLRVPCRVVWTEASPDLAAFAYGSLAGHPFAGEEAFQIERLPTGDVWFTVVGYSRPDVWFTRLAGPLGTMFQRVYLWWLARAASSISEAPFSWSEG